MGSLGPLMLDVEGLSLSNKDRELLLSPEVGGLIFFARNVESKAQFLNLVAEVRKLRPDLLLAVDQEGGRVQRLREGYTRIPPMQSLGALVATEPERGESLCREIGWLMAVELIASGLDFSFAPVLDLDKNSCEVIANRSFHVDPEIAVKAARPFIAGMNEAGMAATGKHFPGHGGVREDSHLETPRDERSLEALMACDLIPFAELSGELAAVMPAHIVYPAVDANPAGFSRFWLEEILRARLGFQGLIFSDDLSMKGADIQGGYVEKSHAALAAGCDMILVCNNREGAMEIIEALRARPSGESDLFKIKKDELEHKLSQMRTTKSWNWSELEQSERRKKIMAALLKLE